MASPKPAETRFYETAKQLCDVASDIVQEYYDKGYKFVEPCVLQVAGGLIANFQNRQKEFIDGFIKKSHMHWDKIRNEEEEFIHNHATEIFGKLPVTQINAFSKLFLEKDANGRQIVSDEDREDIWSYFQSLVRICINYIHVNREPIIHEGKQVYRKSFMKDIQLSKIANDWEMNLAFQ